MMHQLLSWIGWEKPSAELRLHQELSAIELTLAFRSQEVYRLYKEMDVLRDQKEEIKCKLDQYAERKPKIFQLARQA
jgi:hypothetical protein